MPRELASFEHMYYTRGMFDDPLVLDRPAPDPLDVVLDLDSTMAICAAERLQRIDELRRAHLADAEAAGRAFTDVVLRGLRLELAAAMRITEYAAGNLIALRGGPGAPLSRWS